MKRRLKAEQKLKEKAEKEKDKPKEEVSKPKDALKEEEITPNEYFKLRSSAIQAMTSEVAYPHKYHVDISMQDYIDKFTHLTDGQALETESISIAGTTFNHNCITVVD